MYNVTPDGAELVSCWQYGIKVDIQGTFYHLGDMALPIECLEDLNDPGLYEIALQSAEEFIKEHLIITIRPVDEDDYYDEPEW